MAKAYRKIGICGKIVINVFAFTANMLKKLSTILSVIAGLSCLYFLAILLITIISNKTSDDWDWLAPVAYLSATIFFMLLSDLFNDGYNKLTLQNYCRFCDKNNAFYAVNEKYTGIDIFNKKQFLVTYFCKNCGCSYSKIETLKNSKVALELQFVNKIQLYFFIIVLFLFACVAIIQTCKNFF